MTIVASNNLTINNVNDGTITHIAYAYSADGTDRFSTVYPNLNLLINSAAKTKDGFFKNFDKVENGYGEVTLNGTNEYISKNLQDGFSIKPTDYKPNDIYTMSMDIMFTSWNIPAGTTLGEFWIGQRYTGGSWGRIVGIDLPKDPSKMINQWIRITQTTKVPPYDNSSTGTQTSLQTKFNGTNPASFTFRVRNPKQEPGSIATPPMPSASEATNADWPSYIGQYSDFTSTASTDPTKYAPWTVFKGKDGKTGPQGERGKQIFKSSTDYYEPNSSGHWWSDLSPAVSVDNPPKIGDTIINSSGTIFQINAVNVGDGGGGGGTFGVGVVLASIKGPAGSNGDPGKIVSDTEPTTKFKGLTWKYSGTADMTASDGTSILSGTEYYYSGSNWILNSINSHNINGDNLSVTNGTFTNGKIKSTWTSNVASGSTEIETSHINMSATDSSSKATNSLGLDVQQGLGMRWSDPASNQSRSVLLDYGNLSFDRNGVAAGLSFDGTNLSSSMPIQAPNTIVKSTQFSVSGIGIRLDRMMSFVAVTFSGQASSAINNSPTIYNVLPAGFRPISPYSIDYMVPGNTANNGYIYFNPDGSIRIMATINSGYYIRGTRFYITNDVYPS